MQRSHQSRKSSVVFSIGLALFVLAAFGAPTVTAAAPAKSYIVVLNDDVAHPANLAHRHEENRGADIGHIYGVAIKGYSAELTPGELHAIRQDPNVDYVERDYPVHFDSQAPATGLIRVHGPSNPLLDIDGKDDVRINADVAVIDNGVQDHVDLNLVQSVDCSYSSCPASVGFATGHGTHVAGIIGARDNQIGVIGAAPGVRITSLQVTGEISDIVAAVNWVTARASTFEVVNMSLSCYCQPQSLKDAIAASIEKGVVYVASANNESQDIDGTAPAGFPDVIAVSWMNDYDGASGARGKATCNPGGYYAGRDDSLSDYSGWGEKIDITAPGSCIRSTWPYDSYKLQSGSSMAAPLVAGAAAVMASRTNPNSRADVQAIRANLRAKGSYNWKDTSGDGFQEPLLDMATIGFNSSSPRTATPEEGGYAYIAPALSDLTVSNIQENSAYLQGSIDPEGVDARYRFECGPAGGEFELFSTEIYVPVGDSPVPVSATFGNLATETEYQCRLWGSNLAGFNYGGAATFTTTVESKPAPLLLPSNELDVFARTYQAREGVNFVRATTGAWLVNNLTGEVPSHPKLGASPSVIRESSGAIHAFAPNLDGEMIEFAKAPGGPWIAQNLSQVVAGYPRVVGTPSAIEMTTGTLSVFARTTNNELISFERTTSGDWTVFNETAVTNGHPTILGGPAAIVLDPNAYIANVSVFARTTNNELISFDRTPNGAWVANNETAVTNGHPKILGTPAPVRLDPNLYSGSGLSVFARTTTNEMISFDRLMSGAWVANNQTAVTNGHPRISGSPAVVRTDPAVFGTGLSVFARTTSNELISFDRFMNGAWVANNQTAVTNGHPLVE
jgi:Subtilase family/Peptidase inhibitor I9